MEKGSIEDGRKLTCCNVFTHNVMEKKNNKYIIHWRETKRKNPKNK